jgi:predicted transcriptional regulator of viral defense system
MKIETTDRIERARMIFKRHGGTMRTGEAIAAGVHPETLYAMRDTGLLDKLARGVYRLIDAPDLGSPDLVTVTLKIPKGIICMISALAYHQMTSEIPHAVDVALVRGSEPPRIDYPPVHVYWSVTHIFDCGVEEHNVDQRMIRIYSPEKTLVDCFRHRNKMGMDVAIEALRLYRERKRMKPALIMEYARICRAEGMIRPYLESML